MKAEKRDKVKGTLLFVGFLLALPLLYAAPMIFNAITDLLTR